MFLHSNSEIAYYYILTFSQHYVTVKLQAEEGVTIQEIKSLGMLQTENCH